MRTAAHTDMVIARENYSAERVLTQPAGCDVVKTFFTLAVVTCSYNIRHGSPDSLSCLGIS